MNYPTRFSQPTITPVNRLNFIAFQEDRRIIKAQRGDLNSFNHLILAYQDIVFNQAFWILKTEDATENDCEGVEPIRRNGPRPAQAE